MADSGAARARRARAHKAGDHSLCAQGRCADLVAPEPTATAGPVAAVEAEIAQLPAQLRGSPLAATLLVLAGQLAGAGTREVAGVSRELRATLAELRAAAQAAPEEVDPVDELAQRRDQRRASASAHPAGGQLGS